MVVSGFGMVIQFFHFVPFIAIVIVALVSKSATAARQPNTFSITSHFVAQTPAGAAPAPAGPRWRGVAAAAGTTGKFQQ